MGFFFLVVNATLIDLFAFSLTPLSLIAPFAGMTIVFSSLLAASGLISGGKEEEISQTDALVIAIVIGGVTLVSLFGPRSAEGPPPSMETMLSYFSNPPFVAFASSFAVVIFGFAISQRFQRGRYYLDRSAVLKTFCNAFTASGCGALQQVCLKIVATACRETVTEEGGSRALLTPAFWVSLGGLLAFAPLGLVLLNTTLANSPVSYAVPLYQTLLIITTIIAGGTFFLEFGSMDVLHSVLFGLGVVLAIAGLSVLSLRKKGDGARRHHRPHRPRRPRRPRRPHRAHGARDESTPPTFPAPISQSRWPPRSRRCIEAAARTSSPRPAVVTPPASRSGCLPTSSPTALCPVRPGECPRCSWASGQPRPAHPIRVCRARWTPPKWTP